MALILNIFAVIPAVFMMLVLDKVVNYEAYSTLYVITSGVVVAICFNGILGYLKILLVRFFSQKLKQNFLSKFLKNWFSLPMQRFHFRDSLSFLSFTGQISQIKKSINPENIFYWS